MFRTRAAAALVVRGLVGCDSLTAASAIVDGFDDEGIDAIATDGASRLWIVQSKWSDHGDQSISVADINTVLVGLRKITRRDFGAFNDRIQAKRDEICKILDNPNRRITISISIMGSQRASAAATRRIEEGLADFNRMNAERPIVDYRFLLMGDLRQILKDDLREQPIALSVKMGSWHKMKSHLVAYQGEVAVGSVAAWQEEHGERLFERNVRKPLGQTEINLGMVNTLLREPENFGILNNGITMLCDSALPHLWDPSDPDSPVDLKVAGASVVNGAQTVSAVTEAVRQDASRTKMAHVVVKVIVVGRSPESDSFGLQITQATNKQNQVELRDFVALDSAQADIDEDFRLSLPQRYVVKRGEARPTGDEGCTVDEAAKALACAHSEPDIAIRATADLDLLWEQGPRGAYSILFNRRPRSAFEIWNLVQVQRAIEASLTDSGERRRDRAATVADRGELLITYVVIRSLNIDGLNGPTYDVSPAVAQIPELTSRALDWLVHHIDAEFGAGSSITNTFATPQRLTRLVDLTAASMRGSDEAPELPDTYQRTRSRRPNATPTLVDASRLKDGTILGFKYGANPERAALEAWLGDDPRRAQASWLNDRAKPLLWAADGRQYAPTGLVNRMWDLAGWTVGRPKAVNGTTRWVVPGEGSLFELAAEVLNRQEGTD